MNSPRESVTDPQSYTKENDINKKKKGKCKRTRNLLCGFHRTFCKDEYTSENIPDKNLLVPVFRDGKMLVDYTLDEIRQRLNGGKF